MDQIPGPSIISYADTLLEPDPKWPEPPLPSHVKDDFDDNVSFETQS